MDKKLNIKNIEDSGLLLYKVIRGSHAYGLATENSDIDYGAVYCTDLNTIIGTRFNYQEQVTDEHNDQVYYELEKYMVLLSKSNPNVLEYLFVPDNCIVYEHQAFSVIKKQRDKLITKQCILSMFGYAHNQIKKCRSLNKKMLVKPCTERKGVLDFCFTPYNQGSTNIQNWLEYRYMKQEYCGCVNLDNMPNTVGVYYDWKTFFEDYDIHTLLNKAKKAGITTQSYVIGLLKNMNNNVMPTFEDAKNSGNQEMLTLLNDLENHRIRELFNFIMNLYKLNSYADVVTFMNNYKNKDTYRYDGIVNSEGTSNELKLSSVSKGEIPVCIMTFNKNGYSQHCKEYKEYQDWIKNRNPARYESNKDKTYDAKNVMHSFRLIQMCIEIAQGKGFNCNRENIDRDFLLDIKNHKYEYEEIMALLEEKKNEMTIAIESSKLPDNIDHEFLNDICIQIRKKMYNFSN